jgi:dihydrofolate synthase / folylpolyglutamate synthase
MRLGEFFHYRKHADGWDWHCPEMTWLNLPEPAFKGEHQFRNASAVLMAVSALQSVLPVAETAVHTGLISAHLNGRFQLIHGDVPVLLDVGHNPQAVKTLVDYLQSAFPAVKIHAVFAMMKDKDIAGVLAVMRHQVETWYLAPLKNPRAASEELIKNYFQQAGIEHVLGGFADFSAAFNSARQRAQSGELILIFGSFFLVSEYLSKFA